MMSKLRFARETAKQGVPQGQPLDPAARRARFGPIQPMEKPGLLQRLFARD